jgi:menaquinone-dependent protoporphyrinogen oxidase
MYGGRGTLRERVPVGNGGPSGGGGGMAASEPVAGPSVLVVVATKYGSTREIAAAIVRTLGLPALLQEAEHAPPPTGFDAVLVGSAVYAGRWREPARDWVAEHAAALRERPVWLFSSGPIRPLPFPPDEPYDVHALTQLSGARGHRMFPGRLDTNLLSVGELAMVTAMRAPLGDFRDWDAVRAWAAEVGAELHALRR